MIACLSTVRCSREKPRARDDDRRFDLVVRDRPGTLFIDRWPARGWAVPPGRRRPIGTERKGRDRRVWESSSAGLFTLMGFVSTLFQSRGNGAAMSVGCVRCQSGRF